MPACFQVDFFERAKHLEEIPLLEKQCEEEMEKAKEFWEQQERERVRIYVVQFILKSVLAK